MGVERTVAVMNKLEDNYEADMWRPIISKIEEISGKQYGKKESDTKAMRIIADHIKASVFILSDGIVPSTSEQGYVLRRLIRRAIRYGKELGIMHFTPKIAEPILKLYDDYENITTNKEKILEELKKEEEKFDQTLEKGLRQFKKMCDDKKISGEESFLLYQSYGFPFEMTKELAEEKNIKISEKEFNDELKKHQDLSRTASAGKFKSGLGDNSEQTTRLHTATHLLLTALRVILKDENILQKGSNITSERLRFDFSFPRKVSKEELQEVEDLVNSQIQNACEIGRDEMHPSKAKEKGALGVFGEKYGDIVSVYAIGDFSKEICAGPHVKNTCELGKFKIKKESSSSAGVRRIKAILE